MQVRFFAAIREITGANEIRWDGPAATLGDLLHALSGRYGPAFRRWVLDEGDLGKTVLIVVNGHDSRHQGGIQMVLRPEDVIAIFPAIAGGREILAADIDTSLRANPPIPPLPKGGQGGISSGGRAQHGRWGSRCSC